jgi:hypothetical protein
MSPLTSLTSEQYFWSLRGKGKGHSSVHRLWNAELDWTGIQMGETLPGSRLSLASRVQYFPWVYHCFLCFYWEQTSQTTPDSWATPSPCTLTPTGFYNFLFAQFMSLLNSCNFPLCLRNSWPINRKSPKCPLNVAPPCLSNRHWRHLTLPERLVLHTHTTHTTHTHHTHTPHTPHTHHTHTHESRLICPPPCLQFPCRGLSTCHT